MSKPIDEYTKTSRELLDAWRSDMEREQELRDRIAELEAELKECRRTALGDGYERANIEHAGHFAELEAENARLREAGAKIISAIRFGLSQDELEAMEEVELLLGGGDEGP